MSGHRNAPRFDRVLELAMAPLLAYLPPTVIFDHFYQVAVLHCLGSPPVLPKICFASKWLVAFPPALRIAGSLRLDRNIAAWSKGRFNLASYSNS